MTKAILTTAARVHPATTIPATQVDFIGVGGDPLTTRSVQDKDRDIVSAKDFILATDTSPDQWINRALTYAATVVQTIYASNVDLVTSSVLLPAGTYLTANTIYVPEGVVLQGSGKGSTILHAQFGGVAVQVGDTLRNHSNCGVSDLTVLGDYTGTLGSYGGWTSATTVGILMQNCIRACGLDRVGVTGCQVSVQFSGSFQWHVRDCFLFYALTNHVLADNATASEITGCRIDWCAGVDGGIFVNGTSPAPGTVGFHVRGSAIQYCWGTGIQLKDVDTATIEDCHFEANYHGVTMATQTDYAHADVDIVSTGTRGLLFKVGKGCFFTPGDSPAYTSYTAIRCNKGSLDTSGMTLRDSHYYRAVDVLASPGAVPRLVDLGSSITGTAMRHAYDPTVTDVLFEEQDGTGVKTISKLRAGGIQFDAHVTSSNFTSDGRVTDYYVDTTGGARTISLRDDECVAGAHFEIVKTSSDAHALKVGTIQANGSASTKTVNGAATVSSTTAYAAFIVGSDGVNWFVKSRI